MLRLYTYTHPETCHVFAHDSTVNSHSGSESDDPSYRSYHSSDFNTSAVSTAGHEVDDIDQVSHNTWSSWKEDEHEEAEAEDERKPVRKVSWSDEHGGLLELPLEACFLQSVCTCFSLSMASAGRCL